MGKQWHGCTPGEQASGRCRHKPASLGARAPATLLAVGGLEEAVPHAQSL